jgi:hypothetical protein
MAWPKLDESMLSKLRLAKEELCIESSSVE